MIHNMYLLIAQLPFLTEFLGRTLICTCNIFIFSMAQPLLLDSTWRDQQKYESAEAFYQCKIAGTTVRMLCIPIFVFYRATTNYVMGLSSCVCGQKWCQ
jgi:hypothetical protein